MFMFRYLSISVVVAALPCVVAAPAAAQDVIRKACLEHVSPSAKLKYDDPKHALWYQHYWEGKCAGLSEGLFSHDKCSKSSTEHKSANEGIDEVMADAPATERIAVLKRVCKYSELVGFEWARENKIRCIHTSGLAPPFNKNNLAILADILRKKSSKVADRLTEVEAKVKQWCPGIPPSPPRL